VSLLGIDVGTGGCKAAAYAEDGRRLALVYREYELACPGPGLAELDTRELVATGGGAKSDAWLQIQADVLGLPFVRLADTECGVAGAAMLAGIATGVYGSPEEAAARFVCRTRVFEPDSRRHEYYRCQHGFYEQLYPRMADLLKAPGVAC
jgi:sugar (pentulose or hexulose) kinase